MAKKSPPDGYSEFTEYDVPEKIIGVGTILLLIVQILLVFPGIVGWLSNEIDGDIVRILTISLDEILLIGAMVVVHEGIHYAVSLTQGYSPTVGVYFVKQFHGIKEPTPYVVVLNEFISRKENIAMLSMPLLVIDAIALIAIAPIFPEPVAYYAKVVLIVNTSASLQDVYNVVRIWTMEEDTLFLNTREDEIRSVYCTAKN